MEKTVELKMSAARNIMYALDQALPELEELAYAGDVKDSVPSNVASAIRILQEAMLSVS